MKLDLSQLVLFKERGHFPTSEGARSILMAEPSSLVITAHRLSRNGDTLGQNNCTERYSSHDLSRRRPPPYWRYEPHDGRRYDYPGREEQTLTNSQILGTAAEGHGGTITI